MFRSIRKPSAIALSLALAASALAGGVPASAAADPTVMPIGAGAGGFNDNGAIVAFACTDRIELWAPGTTRLDSPSSPFEGEYNRFGWRVFSNYVGVGNSNNVRLDSSISNPNSGNDLEAQNGEANPGFAYPLAQQSFTAGTTLQLTLEGFGTPNQQGASALPAKHVNFAVDVIDFDDVFDPSKPATGSGTASDPYRVSTPEQLNAMRCATNKHFRMTNDIDLSGFNGGFWVPLRLDSQWRGVFDGGGHSITGLRVDRPFTLFASLFGTVERTIIENLNIPNAVIKGDQHVAVLAARGANLSVRNVTVSNAQVEGTRLVGLLTGERTTSGIVSNNHVQGVITSYHSITRASSPNSPFAVSVPRRLGGLVGLETSDGSGFFDNSVDVEIVVGYHPNLIKLVEDEVVIPANVSTIGNTTSAEAVISVDLIAARSSDGVGRIGGFIGDHATSSKGIFHSDRNSVSSAISVEFAGTTQEIGGAVGYSDNSSPLSGTVVDSTINIVQLADGREIRSIGGAFGEEDDGSPNSTKVRAKITIETANGTNNALGHTLAPTNATVRRVGGLIGLSEDRGGDYRNSVEAEIDIKGFNTVSDIAGYIGQVTHDFYIGFYDTSVQGSINIESIGSIARVAGYMNHTRSNPQIASTRVISAVVIDVDAPQASDITEIQPFMTARTPTYVHMVESYFDGELNTQLTHDPSLDADLRDLGVAATTADLKSAAWLTARGFDMVNLWELTDGKYPTIRESYIMGQQTSVGGGGSGGGGPIPLQLVVSGNSTFGAAGGTLTLTGSGITGVRLEIAGKPVFAQVVSDSLAYVVIPSGLEPGVYSIVALGAVGNVTLQSAFTITGATVVESTGSARGWTRAMTDGTIKMYARDVIGAGKVTLRVNGREIAWVRAVDATDPKLNVGPAGQKDGLVRTITLAPGKNALEIFVDGTRIWRAAYTGR